MQKYLKKSNISQWYEFIFDGRTGAEVNKNIIKLTFVDGLKGDDALTENGIIIDLGGPGVKSIISSEFDSLIIKRRRIMKRIRRIVKPGSLFLAILMITVFTPYQTVLAKMISTETVIEAGRAHEARMYVNSVLAREDVMASLISQGIDMTEAKARVDNLTDSEIVSLADQIETAPAGGGAIGIIVGAAVVVFIVLVITDVLGYTDIFPFIKKLNGK